MVQETRVQSQGESYQRLKKWYLIPPCLTLSIIRYVSRVKWSHPGKGVAPSPTPRCSSYWKESLQVALDYSRQLYLVFTLEHLFVSMQLWFQVFLSNTNNLPNIIWFKLLLLLIIIILILLSKQLLFQVTVKTHNLSLWHQIFRGVSSWCNG